MEPSSDRPPASSPPSGEHSPQGLTPGTIIDRRYRIDKPLGAGGMGLVVQATHLVTGRIVAIKVVRPEFAFTRDIVERFEREAQVLALVDHPSVVRMYDVGTLPDGALYLAMELLRGETLRDRMRRDRPISPQALLPIVKSVAAGLDAIHSRGIVHRDLKPANVFLPAEPAPGAEAKLVDFGISKLAASDMRLTKTGEIIGTPRYMAPEQLSERGELDGRVDVYAFGVVIYEALSGTTLFQSDGPAAQIDAILAGSVTPLAEVRPEISPALGAVVANAMRPDPSKRYRTAGELARDFEAALTDAPELAAPPPTSDDARLRMSAPPTRRQPRPVLTEPDPEATAATTSLPPPTRIGRSVPPPTARRSRAVVALLVALVSVLAFALVGVVLLSAGLVTLVGLDDRKAPSTPPQTTLPVPVPATAPTSAQLTPAPSAHGDTVTVTTEPPGAVVFVEGAAVGNTPIDVERPSDNLFVQIEVRLPGYRTQSVTISSLTTGSLVIPMARERVRRPRTPPPSSGSDTPSQLEF